MKRVLVTAGTVYGRLDDNKLVGNRIRGIWATKFAIHLAEAGYDVTLLVPDTMDTKGSPFNRYPLVDNGDGPVPLKGKFTLRIHNGYDSYAAQCYELAPNVDAAVMAAAVVNWIPEIPFKGKMPTEGFLEGAIQHIPFILAPRVIDRMKKINSKLSLIGCKMTSGATHEELIKAAYHSLIKAHANVVVANDLSMLKEKVLLFPDGSKIFPTSFDEMYSVLLGVINDEHYSTVEESDTAGIRVWEGDVAAERMNRIIEKYRDGFTQRVDGMPRVFGGIAVRAGKHFLVSPREKGSMWGADQAVLVTRIVDRTIYTVRGRKASLNAPVLINHLLRWGGPDAAVLHQHQQKEGVPTEHYAPPGTVRDNERVSPARTYNIKGHGFVALLDDKNEIIP